MILAALGDVHAPYIDPFAVSAALKVIRKLRPDVVVQVGDAYEFDNGSRWRAAGPRETPQEEFRRGRKVLEELWEGVRAAAPRARCVAMYGNHDERLAKRAYEVAPEVADFVRDGVKKMLTFPGVTLVDQEVVKLGRFGGEEWSAVHGHGAIGSHAAQYARNLVLGHLHRGYVTYVPGGYCEVNAGWLGDGNHHSKFYARARASNWNHGLAVVDDFGPRFIRLEDR